MNLVEHLTKLNKLINEVSNTSSIQDVNVRARVANVLRIYYLGLNQLFITQKILKNINFGQFIISGDEVDHIRNAGWILDEKYREDVYMPALKSNLIIDLWSVVPQEIKDKQEDSFIVNYNNLVTACLNNGKIKDEIKFDFDNVIINQKPGEEINSITSDIALMLFKKIIEKLN